MIKIQNSIPTREPLPQFLRGLKPESLVDLTWTDPALGVSDSAWWPEVDQSPALGEFERYGSESLTVDNDNQRVIVTRPVERLSDVEIESLLADKRAIKHADRIKALESARESGFVHNGYKVASDMKSQAMLTTLNTEAALALLDGTQTTLDAFAAGLGNGWRAIDGTIVATDAAGFRAMIQSWYAHVAATDANSQSIKAAIEAATTLAELGAIDVTSGYPEA